MATGPSHFERAKQLLAESRSIGGDELDPLQLLTVTLLEAQVHATLALAAAVAVAVAEDVPKEQP